MRRNVMYLLILIIVGAGTYYVFFKKQDEPFDKNEANFNVKNTDDIKTIFLSSLNGENLKFTKQADEWILNDSIEIVQSLMQDVLEALRDQKAVQPVSISMHDYVIREMSSNSTKVEIYTDKGKTNTFYVAQNASGENLTYMLTEGAKRPYIVKLPLQSIFLGIRYHTNINNWRSRKIMRAKANEIKSIDIQYIDSAQYSFHLENNGAAPTVIGNLTLSKPLNLKRVHTYLGLWDSIYCLGFETRNKIKDTMLLHGKKLAEIVLQRKSKPEQTLTIYFKPVTKGTKGLINIGSEQFDFDVFMGFLNKRDMIILNRAYTEMMLRTYPEFFEEEK